MRPARWQQIKEIFHSAIGLEPAERAEFLAAACAGRDSLRREVESLISAHDQTGSFMDSPGYRMAEEMLAEGETELKAGQQVGRYEIVALIGAGGMGEVYLAEDERLGRRVALKLLPASFVKDEKRLRRFEQEARAASALNHPNILTIYETGEADSLHFIATEYVEGQTLRERLESPPMSLAEVLSVAVQIADALSAAHKAGIIHRDIKPENVMLREDGLVKVLDFGLAKLVEGRTVSSGSEAPTLMNTAPGMIMGTVAYMSPEQARGLAVDARSDIWSLGCVLYEMLAGRTPFQGQTATDTLAAIVGREPPPVESLTADPIPDELIQIINKALKKEKEERYQTSQELLSDLRRLKERLEFEAKFGQLAPPAASDNSATARREEPRAGKSPRLAFVSARRAAVFAAVVVAIIAGTVAYMWRWKASSATSRSEIKSLAVLPLLNGGGDAEKEYLADGITESLINSLSQLPGLKVMSRNSVFRFKGRETDAQQVAHQLGVEAVMTGDVNQVNDQLVINVELIDAGDGSVILSRRYVRGTSDVIAMQSSIARDVADNLRLKLSGEEQRQLAKQPTADPAAYQLYLRGRYYWNKRTEESIKKAVEYFRQAIDLDPNYALAYSGLADCYNSFGFSFDLGSLPPSEAIPKAKEAAAKALEIDDTLAEAHTSLAYAKLLYDWDWQGAEGEFKRALELDPNYVNAHHWYSHYLIAVGRTEESLAESKRSLELDPLGLIINTHLGWHYIYARQYDAAIEQLRKTLELDPDYGLTHWYLGLAYEQKRMYAEASPEFRKATELLGGNLVVEADVGHYYAVSGKRDEARKVIEELQKLSKQRYVSPFEIALIYTGLGDKEQAFDWLERAYREHSDMLVYLNVDPRLDDLRSDPRFTDLLRRVGFPSSTK